VERRRVATHSAFRQRSVRAEAVFVRQVFCRLVAAYEAHGGVNDALDMRDRVIEHRSIPLKRLWVSLEEPQSVRFAGF
jgi:hypothetical protein